MLFKFRSSHLCIWPLQRTSGEPPQFIIDPKVCFFNRPIFVKIKDYVGLDESFAFPIFIVVYPTPFKEIISKSVSLSKWVYV